MRLDRADLGDGDLEVRQDLQQERLELVVGPVDLINEQDGGVTGFQGGQQRALQQERGAEYLVGG